LATTTNSSPVTYRLSNRNCTNGCGLFVGSGATGIIAPVSYNFGFFNQGVTLNYSNATNTIFVSSPTNTFYSTNGGATPVVWIQTPSSLYPYALITPRSSAALTSVSIIPSTASEYIYPPMPDYTVQYDGNGATGGNIPVPQYMSPYTATSSITIGGNTGSLVKTDISSNVFVFTRWNTNATGTGTDYGPGYTTTYDTSNNPASLILYAQWGYSVTYNGNTSTGGSVPVDASSPYNPASSVTVLGNTGSLVKAGFTFNGWNTAANGSGTPYSPTNTFTINVITILYAQWI
jgi:hypothetical protein